jgi:LysR family hydrogen peroxide-inducible transcriptional activator
MELHQLRYFVAVAEAGNFGRAAARCRVSQPSLSQQIIKLEAQFGRKLFDRLGRRIALTDAGLALLPRAKAILAEVIEAEREMIGDLDSGRGRLAIGAIPTIAPYLLPGVIRTFLAINPEADLTVSEDVTDGLIEAIADAELDLALMSLPIDDPRISYEELMIEPLLLVAPADDPIARGEARRSIVVAWHPGRHRPKLAERFLDLLRQECKNRSVTKNPGQIETSVKMRRQDNKVKT